MKLVITTCGSSRDGREQFDGPHLGALQVPFKNAISNSINIESKTIYLVDTPLQTVLASEATEAPEASDNKLIFRLSGPHRILFMKQNGFTRLVDVSDDTISIDDASKAPKLTRYLRQ